LAGRTRDRADRPFGRAAEGGRELPGEGRVAARDGDAQLRPEHGRQAPARRPKLEVVPVGAARPVLIAEAFQGPAQQDAVVLGGAVAVEIHRTGDHKVLGPRAGGDAVGVDPDVDADGGRPRLGHGDLVAGGEAAERGLKAERSATALDPPVAEQQEHVAGSACVGGRPCKGHRQHRHHDRQPKAFDRRFHRRAPSNSPPGCFSRPSASCDRICAFVGYPCVGEPSAQTQPRPCRAWLHGHQGLGRDVYQEEVGARMALLSIR